MPDVEEGTGAPIRVRTQGRPWYAFGVAIPIGTLGGLIGLGGAEFRLPVLAGPLGYPARRAVALNVAISLITVLASLAIRSGTLTLAPIMSLLLPIAAMIAGAMITAFVGTALVGRLSNERLERVILVFLTLIGSLLIIEGFLPTQFPALIPDDPFWQVVSGSLFGLVIGLVSSMLGVAGGELIIPTLIFAYGAEIKAAGSASLLISLPTVLIGVVRYLGQGAYQGQRDLNETIAPMGIGSVIGAVIGGLLVGIVPSAVLKVGLGIILIWSASRIFYHRRDHPPVPL
ncbi:MAG: sulfite exporter TauE/SafE family protein [Roseiflexus sp.]|nr:sulfite exporter TauE/SafE family protein [Roseiflexus sp.]MCS7287969.1 sulfite exporter TauE/SafE family protein [Roseiflexus sp.]MDW8148859.1 sulfite exporter TauE/SafE family protein [Roseiflexaceae bacterium]MDW8233528.1 sulfite exporter TauE/SafE family protein [Roseiflexaceae bacterium]